MQNDFIYPFIHIVTSKMIQFSDDLQETIFKQCKWNMYIFTHTVSDPCET